MTSRLHPLMAAICEDFLAAPKVLREAQEGRLSHDPSQTCAEKAPALVKQRNDRAAQAKHRGTRRSIKTDLENALLMLAWEAAELSEGQVSSMLNINRVALRRMREAAIAEGLRLADLLDRGRQLAHMVEAAQRAAEPRAARQAHGATARVDAWDQAVTELAKARETGADASTLRRLESAEEMARDAVYEARDIEPKPLFGEDE